MLLEAYSGQFGNKSGHGGMKGLHSGVQTAPQGNELTQRMERVMKLTKDFN